MDRRTQDIPVKQIFVRTDRKKTFTIKDDKIKVAVNDIQLTGILEPIGVRPSANDKYELIFGRKRLWIAKHLGYSTIPAVIMDVPDAAVDFVTFSENTHRSQMRPGEYIRYIQMIARAREKAGTIDLGKAAGGIARAGNAIRESGRFVSGAKTVTAKNESPKDPSLSPPANAPSALAGDKPSGEEPDAPVSFATALSQTTGKKTRQIKTDIKIAKTLTPEQLQDLDEVNASNDDMEKISKIENEFQRGRVITMFCGCEGQMKLDDIMAELVGNPTMVKLEAVAAEATLSDSEWLEKHCHKTRSKLQNTAIFDRDAVLYRSTRPDRAKFHAAMKKPALQLKAKGYHPFAAQLIRVIYVEHPNDWYICFECNGDNVDHPKCDVCHGTGYTLKCAETPRVKG